MTGLLGVVFLLAVAWAASTDRRRALNARVLLWGFGLQLAIAVVALRTPVGARFFIAANDVADAFIGFTDAGIRFVFGDWPRVTIVNTPAPGGGAGGRSPLPQPSNGNSAKPQRPSLNPTCCINESRM